MSNLKKHSVLTDKETKHVKRTPGFIFVEYYYGFVVVIAFVLLFPASLSRNIIWEMVLAFITAISALLPFFGVVPSSGSLEPLDNRELKRFKELAQAHAEIMEWVRPAAAAGLVFRVRDLEAAEGVAGELEDRALLAEETVERQSIYAELASGASQDDHNAVSQGD